LRLPSLDARQSLIQLLLRPARLCPIQVVMLHQLASASHTRIVRQPPCGDQCHTSAGNTAVGTARSSGELRHVTSAPDQQLILLINAERTSRAMTPHNDAFKRTRRYPDVTFDFLGSQFRPRTVRSSRDNKLFCSFAPAVSPSALKAIRSTVRDLNIRQQTQRPLDDTALKPAARLKLCASRFAAGSHTACSGVGRYRRR
jgi:hypothetical protein